MLADDFVAHLACPVSKQPLIFFPHGPESTGEYDACFVCPASRLRYRVTDGVPVLLEDEAERLTDAQIDRLIERARFLGLAVPA